MKRWVRWSLVVAAVLVVGGALTLREMTGSWRLAFSRSYWNSRLYGKADYDAGNGILRHGNPKYHEIALTFDDGPHTGTGDHLLDVLQRENVHATFFVVGVRMKQRPDLVRRMLAEGHEVGNHTFDHLRLDELKPEKIRSELVYNDINLCRITRRHFGLLRPPGVRYNAKVIKVARSLNYQIISWGVAGKDFEPQTPDYIVSQVLKGTIGGSIILLHDEYPATVEALPRIIAALKRDGYKFVTIPEMLAHLPRPVIVPSTVATNPQTLTAHGPMRVAHARTGIHAGNLGGAALRNP